MVMRMVSSGTVSSVEYTQGVDFAARPGSTARSAMATCVGINQLYNAVLILGCVYMLESKH